MSISIEWKQKIEYYVSSLPDYICSEAASVPYTGFVTMDRLSLQEALMHERSSFPEGTQWGKRWEYIWLFAEITIPEVCAGSRVVFSSDNGEGVVFVNGEVRGSFDWTHKTLTLTTCAKGGEHYTVAMEIYAGHGTPVVMIGALNEKTKPVLEDCLQNTIKKGSISVWNDDVFDSWLNLKTLYGLSRELDENSNRKQQIDKALKKYTAAINLEQDIPHAIDSIIKANEHLQDVIACKNGPSAPTIYAFGHSHLDLEWLWTDNETIRKVARTLGNQLELFKEYPNYIYIQSQPWLLSIVERDYPELYTKVCEAIRSGNIVVEGGMWVESDTNIPSGESLIRQFVYGKKFISDKFGVDSKLLWLPDVFGCSGNLPQIMAGCGIDYFVSAKIPWVYNGAETFPKTNFWWKGVDGTEILSHVFQNYESQMTPSGMLAKWKEHKNKEDAPIQLYPFGYGDGGGGPIREHLECEKKLEDLEGLPKIRMASPIEYFEDLNNIGLKDKYFGELYFPSHRGTYTSQALTKRLNRKAEIALRNAEMLTALFDNAKANTFSEEWKTLLFNQFHDIIPGSSIAEVYVKTNRELQEIIDAAEQKTVGALKKYADEKKDCLTVFNSLSFSREAIVALPTGATAATLFDGTRVPVQEYDGIDYAAITIPAIGSVSLNIKTGNHEVSSFSKKVNSPVLENDVIRVLFNDDGEIISLIDKTTGNEFIENRGNRFRLFKDMPMVFDAWDIDSIYEDYEVEQHADTELCDFVDGELFSGFTIRKKIGESDLEQKVRVYRGKKQVDFDTVVNWRETHKLLKVYFETNLNSEELVSEIQYGTIRRPAVRNNKYDEDRFEVCQHRWSGLFEGKRGLSVLNDCKYGVGANDRAIGLTLLRAPAAPDLNADKRLHQFTYSVAITDDVTEAVLAGYELNVPVITCEGYHSDTSFFDVSARNVMIDTVKLAEDGSGDIIVRLYECENTMTKCQLATSIPFEKAIQTNMIEEDMKDLETSKGIIPLDFRGMEVVTVRLKR